MKAEKPNVCSERHGIHESFGVLPHPLDACAELIELGKTPVTFNDVFMSDEFGRMAGL